MGVDCNLAFRDQLVNQYQNYARAISFKIVQQFRIPLEFIGDLIAAANLGLVEAAGKFDPNYGVDFKAYAFFRIRGEAIDFLRKSTNLTTVQYRQLKTLKELDELALRSVHQERFLSKQEINPINTTVRHTEKNSPKNIVKILNLLTEGAILYQLHHTSNPKEQYLANYSAEISATQISEKINFLLEALNEKEYKLIYDYYFLDKSFLEIATEMNNISKSWMSRLHHQALGKMREAYLKNSND